MSYRPLTASIRVCTVWSESWLKAAAKGTVSPPSSTTVAPASVSKSLAQASSPVRRRCTISRSSGALSSYGRRSPRTRAQAAVARSAWARAWRKSEPSAVKPFHRARVARNERRRAAVGAIQDRLGTLLTMAVDQCVQVP